LEETDYGFLSNAAKARSIPLVSVGSITLNSTPDDDAMAWIAAN
jgi:hypothetical protein